MRVISIVAASLVLAAGAAQAEDFYIGVSVGASQFNGTADADPNQFGSINTIPAQISIDGLPFESTETSWSAYAGWNINKRLALELGFSDLGNSGRQNPTFFAGSGVILNSGVSLNVEEWYLGVKFSAPLSPKLSAYWTVGLTRAEFDTEGFLPVLTGAGFFDAEIEKIPFASPGEETGLIWGFGFSWTLSERVGLGVGYRKHNLQVIDIDSLMLGMTFSTR